MQSEAADGPAGVAETLAFAEVERTSISSIESESFNPSIDLFDRLAAVLVVVVAKPLLAAYAIANQVRVASAPPVGRTEPRIRN